MTTFVLTKYQPTEPLNEDTNAKANDEAKAKEDEKLIINIEGSVAEIVANALRRVLGNKAVIEQIEDENEATDKVKAISTEDINQDPLKAFNSIGQGDIVLIQNHGFKTAMEDWFLLNMPNKTPNVFYSVESFMKYICERVGVSYDA